MDSMRSLNTSLPAAYSSRPAPREQLLQAFKTAALSVTNLYKSAAADQQTSRAAGYQDALDDLLRMMDSENLGVQDGEGWRIRQWVTERYDPSANAAAAASSSEVDDSRTAATDSGRDDAVEDENAADSRLHDACSDTDAAVQTLNDGQQPEQQAHRQQQQQQHPPLPSLPPARPDSAPPVFRFSAGTSGPAGTDSDDMQVNDSPKDSNDPSPPPIQVQLINRTNRPGLRNSSQRLHHPRTSSTPKSSSSASAGSKRKLNQLHAVPDFFNISNFNFRDDGDGSSGNGNSSSNAKRSRIV